MVSNPNESLSNHLKPYHNYHLLSNKFDSFNTRVSETIGLFLLPKILAGQGFSAFSILGLVSLWSVGTELHTAKQVLLRHKTNHAETLLPRKVSA